MEMDLDNDGLLTVEEIFNRLEETYSRNKDEFFNIDKTNKD